ncbi:MAG: CNNM domain-containing protein, partial [Byssovorax sp.]
MTTLLYLGLAFLLVFLNAFFVAAEFALVKMRPTRLEQLIRGGDARARLALRMSQHLDEYLSACQIGVTLASLALGWVGEPAVAHFLEPRFAALGGWALTAAH